MDKTRCDWAWVSKNERDRHYHDTEWGKELHNEHALFKQLILEGKQAGLSWSTILQKLDTLCEAFDDFVPEKLIHYDEAKIESLLQNSGIIKNRLKVNAVVHNAKMYFKLCEEHGSLDRFLWTFVDYKPIINRWERSDEVPATTPLSDEISRQLKKQGFKFVGSTTIYALMQAIGMVNDHLLCCSFRGVE